MRPWRHISSASCFALKPGLSFAFWKASYTGLDSGLVHTVEATAANVHDVTEASRLLTGDEDEVYGDSGYLGSGKREDAIVRLSKEEQAAVKEAEHAKSSVRAKVEHVFGVVKKQLRF